MARYTWAGVSAGLLSCVLLVGCGGDEAHRDFDSLSAALESARPGDTVRIGSVRIDGGRTLDVPPGVTLAGAGTGTTTVVAPSDSVAITLRASTTVESRVTGVTVESGGRAGFLVIGDGTARIDDAEVVATRGIGIGAEDVEVLILDQVTLTGPVTPENEDSMPLDPTPADTATHGLVLVNVADARLTDVRTDAFALFGSLFVSSDVSWQRGGANGNLGTGVMASGGNASLEQLTVCGSLQGLRLIPSYGTVFANAVDVDSTGLTVCDGDGFGMLSAASAVGTHSNLVATGNDNAAVWVQDNDQFELSGSGSMISDNSFAGLVIARSSNVRITDATVQDTRMAIRLSGEVGTVNVGDGIQIVRGTTGVTLDAVQLVNNDRTGFLADLDGGSTDTITISNTTATSSGAATGAVAQNGTVSAGWDSGITRAGAATANDAAFATSGVPYDIVGVVAPTDLPMAASIEAMGLDAVGVVAPSD